MSLAIPRPVQSSDVLQLGETLTTAYRGDRGKIAYDHSQVSGSNPHSTPFSALLSKPTTLAGYGITDALPLTGGAITPATDSTDTLRINRANGTRSLSLGTVPSLPSSAAFWAGSATPNDANFIFASSGTDSYFNSPLGGALKMAVGGVRVAEFYSNLFAVYQPETNEANGAASTPASLISGTWYSGGTTTSTKPQLLIQPYTATTSTGWSTLGTGLGINAASLFTGNLIDAQLNGVSKFKVDYAGAARALSLLTGADNTILNSTWGVASNFPFQAGGSGNGSYQFSTGSAQGSSDGGVYRGGAGLVDVRADNGLRIRNLANSAYGTLQAGTISGLAIGVYPYVVISDIYGGLGLASTMGVKWAASADYTATKVLGVMRDASNNVEINSGTLVASGGTYCGLKAGAGLHQVASNSDSPANAPLLIRNSNSTQGTTTGQWSFGVGHAGSYDGSLKIVGPFQTSQNQWTLMFSDNATAGNRGVSTPGFMSASYFASTVQGIGDGALVQWVGTGTNWNGTTFLGLNHPYGNHPVKVVISQSSGFPNNASGTKFSVVDGSSVEWFSVDNTGKTITGVLHQSWTSGVSDPTTSTIADGKIMAHKRTDLGEVRFWANDGGTIKKLAAFTT